VDRGPKLVTLFRVATEDDVLAIVRLQATDTIPPDRELTSEPVDPCYIRAFQAIASDDNQLMVVADEGGEVIGTLQLTFIPGLAFRGAWRGQVESVRVAADRRNGGVGEGMIGWAVARCRERGCRMVQLTSTSSRTDAHRFYERLGFRPTHTGFKLILDESI
jgi:GNAT superfamily N-acetyltransferase